MTHYNIIINAYYYRMYIILICICRIILSCAYIDVINNIGTRYNIGNIAYRTLYLFALIKYRRQVYYCKLLVYGGYIGYIITF